MKLAKTSRTARNVLIANAVIAFARDRLAAQLPGVKPRRRRRPGAKTLLLGVGIAVVGAAILLRARQGRRPPARPWRRARRGFGRARAAAGGELRRGGSGCRAPRTAVPIAPADESPALDEAEEEAAAGAEAANIGGPLPDDAGAEADEIAAPDELPPAEADETPDELPPAEADEIAAAAELTPAEAGEGEAGGAEQAEDELRPAAEPVPPRDDSDGRTWSGRKANP